MPLRQHVFELVAATAECPVEQIVESKLFLRDLEISSLEAIALLCEVEEHFDIELDEVVVLPITTVGELVEIVAIAVRRR